MGLCGADLDGNARKVEAAFARTRRHQIVRARQHIANLKFAGLSVYACSWALPRKLPLSQQRPDRPLPGRSEKDKPDSVSPRLRSGAPRHVARVHLEYSAP